MYNLNINKSSVVPTNLIVGRVLDKPFDVFQFKIFNGLDPLDLTSSTIEFRGVTPDDKKVISTDVKIIDAKSGEIEFKIPSNFYSASGKFRNAYFRITKSGQTESTNDLLINVLNAVDLNLDDSQIIIDQLDKIIEDAIAKLDKELANVKLQISQVDGNIKALKKDVEDYKATFKVQMDAMQKQLDELAKAINQTDIQRPQITAPNGRSKDVWTGSFDLLNNIKSLGAGLHTVYATSSNSQMPLNHAIYTCIVQVHDMGSGSKFIGFGRITAYSTYDGSTYVQTIRDNVLKGWVRLDGQAQKITQDDGLYKVLNNSDVSTQDLLKSLGKGMHQVMLVSSKNQPDSYIIGTYQSNELVTGGTFIGSTTFGKTYTYTFNTQSELWKSLNIEDIPNATQSQDGLMTPADKVKLDGLQNYSLVTTSTNGLMSASDKVKLNGLKSYSNATPSASGLMSATDKKKLDGITFTKVGTV